LLHPHDESWRTLAPAFAGAVALARAGVPFHIALERRYDRTGDPRRLSRALARGATIYVPQAHQVLPRVARLMVALREHLLGAGRGARVRPARAPAGPPRGGARFPFRVAGRGRKGLGLHREGAGAAFGGQPEGRPPVRRGPPVRPRTPARRESRSAGGPGWRT